MSETASRSGPTEHPPLTQEMDLPNPGNSDKPELTEYGYKHPALASELLEYLRLQKAAEEYLHARPRLASLVKDLLKPSCEHELVRLKMDVP